MSFESRQGEVVTLLGRNGMGKTTTVRSIMGMHAARGGKHRVSKDNEIAGCPSYRIAQAGHRPGARGPAGVPEPHRAREPRRDRGQPRRARPWTLERVFALFPQLQRAARQLGNQLSGGEQQMLAIGRALMTNPRLLILDEATEGLAPLVRAEIYRSIERLKSEGLSILLIDKDVDALARVADRHYVLEKGRVVWSGAAAELTANAEVQHRYLGV